MKTNNIIRFLTMLIIPIGMTGCKEFLDIPPPKNALISNSVFSNNAGAVAAQSAIYVNMGYSNFNYFNKYPNFLSDEWMNYSSADDALVQLSRNAIRSDNSFVRNFWQDAYLDIYQANAVLEGVTNSSGISEQVKNQLTGEAKFTRAFWYFYLVNFFGDVPLITSTSYQENTTVPRTATDKVYEAIIQDLKDAQSMLNDNYLGGDAASSSSQRVRPNKATAAAFLARVYLFNGNYKEADAIATAVIKNPLYSLETDLDNVFLITSKEVIWQLPVRPSFNSNEGLYYNATAVLRPGDPSVPGALAPDFPEIFESGDNRKKNWLNSITYTNPDVTYYYPFKYKQFQSTTETEYETVFRLAELFLIRSEARVYEGDISGAQADLNIIRSRAGLVNTGANDKASMLSAILHERQTELFAEFAYRWLDLKRTKNIDDVMSKATVLKGGTWDTRQQLYPIPASQIIANPNLTQNPGY